MTLTLMIYSIIIGSLLAGAAFFLDRGLRALGRPARWAWILGLSATAGAPLLPLLSAENPPLATQGRAIPVYRLYEMLAPGGTAEYDSPAFNLGLTLVFLWAFSSLLVVGTVAWTAFRLHRTARRLERRRLGRRSVLVSEGLGPAVLGFRRPTIILPRWALGLEATRLNMILLHEDEHRRARDPALLTLGLILVASAPWNPALWWMIRRLHLAVEGDCDRRVLARGIPAKTYGALLLEVATGSRALSALTPALAEGGNSFLERRLLMIRSDVRNHRLGVAALAALASAGLVLMACETPTPPVQAEEEVSLEAPADAAAPSQIVVRKEEPDPDKVRIRVHGTNVSDARPLIVVDGVILSDQDALDDINPDDIESIEVLKGAAAKELFGEEGADGVIKITMKG